MTDRTNEDSIYIISIRVKRDQWWCRRDSLKWKGGSKETSQASIIRLGKNVTEEPADFVAPETYYDTYTEHTVL